ncbi:nickel-dependent lactate racemase [Anaerotignum sp. MSJ-24]|uniref:nickel-dependent lactate racemase n=1 Tax=Anaerotignum sp. MSJ-24 TaxID=2841521 RepID=UPI001C11DD36|nr:nickel-dependent lactate racemase [Anaerotignum sp. MSJ-24]MBD9218784.1 nickel-dependent lactate racemase [Clostridiales bacterium]MBU5464435.1 nickel-dependent lactate racemase [Anaerotignum sp. MSJ-24]
MAKYTFKYGNGTREFEYPEEDVIKVLEPSVVELPHKSEEEIIRDAIENPIGSPKLEEIVKPGQSVCIVVPDVTRAWARPAIICHVLVEKLEKIGVKDEDIIFLSAVGTHRLQEEVDFENLIGKDFCARFKHINNHADNEDEFVVTGTSTRGNVMECNKFAMECDHRILVGGIVFHFLAGFGGGRKTILPGISSRKTINFNHKLYFKPGPAGSGAVETCANGVMEGNPVHEDMIEAAKFAKVSFIVNSVVDSSNKIAQCFAGDVFAAHKAGTDLVKKIDGVKIDQKADLVIASACGYPKDINYYQGVKPVFNAVGAIKPGEGVLILVSQCSEGWGNPDTEKFAFEFDNMLDREVFLRENYGIGRYVGFRLFEVATQIHYILVSDMDPDQFVKTDVIAVKTIEEAIAKAKEITGKDRLSTYIMPYAANTMASMDI